MLTIQGKTFNNIAGIDPTYNDMRQADRPYECLAWRSIIPTLSSYYANEGGLGTNSIIWALTNQSTTVSLAIRRIGLSFVGSGASGIADFGFYIGRNYTAYPTGYQALNGATINSSTNTGKHRTSFTATGENTVWLGGGYGLTATRTVDANPISIVGIYNNIPINPTNGLLSMQQDNVFKATDNSDYPIILAPAEGLEFQNLTSIAQQASPTTIIFLEYAVFTTGWGNP
jgi:hypothetical protein